MPRQEREGSLLRFLDPQALCHVSYSHYYGYQGHTTGGHKILCRVYIKAPTSVLVYDPCPCGQLIILTVAHVTVADLTEAIEHFGKSIKDPGPTVLAVS